MDEVRCKRVFFPEERKEREESYKARGAMRKSTFAKGVYPRGGSGMPSGWMTRESLPRLRRKNAPFIWENKKFQKRSGESNAIKS